MPSLEPTEETVDLSALVPDVANVRTRDVRALEVLSNSLKQFGAARSIVVDKDNVILAGNGTLEAAAEAGIRKVRIIEADGSELIAVRRSDLAGTDRAAYAIADNRTGELAEWDGPALDAMLQSLHDAEHDLAELGFTEDDLRDMFENPDFSPADPATSQPLDQSTKPPVTCPKCGHEFQPETAG